MIHPAKILKELGIAPLKKFGQNFQIDTHIVENLAEYIPHGAQILEIGPGLGAWTEVFYARGHKMILAEKDRTLAARLRQIYADDLRVHILEGDFLECETTRPPVADATAAIGNLPFYATSAMLLKIVVDCESITHGLFGVQLEVAERIAAQKGSSLAVALAASGTIELAGKIARTSFFPPPQVDAAIIAFTRRATPRREHLRLLLKAAFWGKRKALATALRENPFWKEHAVGAAWLMRIDALRRSHAHVLTRRADDLSVAEFLDIYDALMS